MAERPVVALVGATLDTKGAECLWVAGRLRESGVDVVLIDAGIMSPEHFEGSISVTQDEVAEAADTSIDALRAEHDRGAAVTAMGEGAASILSTRYAAGDIDGVLALGGSGGSAIVARAVRDLPIGLPKLIVSTMASGDVSPYVGASDVTMMYSVVDIAGINSLSRTVLGNAAAAMRGWRGAPARAETGERSQGQRTTPALTASMFGVRPRPGTPARARLEAARLRGARLPRHRLRRPDAGSADRPAEPARRRTGPHTTELADELVGGVLSAGPDRLTAAGARVPQVVSLGALDMVNFGPSTVPAAIRRPAVLRPQRHRHADADDRRRECGARRRSRRSCAAASPDGPGDPARRGLGAGRPGPAVPRRRRRTGSVRRGPPPWGRPRARHSIWTPISTTRVRGAGR